jgi:protein-S-isoprenylcysteine O-methyltransferase Ste14
VSETPPDGQFDRPTQFPWPPVLLVLVVAGAWVLQASYPLTWPGLDDLPARVAGLGLGLAGLALLVWSALTLRRAQTTILPHAGASVLVTDGPFRFRRNPIYLADMLILIGLAELTKNIWIVLLIPVFAVLVTWLAIIPEEKHLEARFGDAYRVYKERTRRLI